MESIFQENNFMTLMVIGILIMLAFAMAFVLFVNHSQKRLLKEQMRVQKLAYKHQEELLHATILTQEKERHRIARDLHDEIGSKLNVIFLNVCRLKKYGKADEEIGAITTEVETVVNTTINSIRFISHELLPPTLEEFGLIETIRELQHSYNLIGDLQIDFTAEGENKIDDSLIELNLFRVLQELINNSIRHGKATEIDLKLSIEKEAITFSYQDNGIGFDSTNKAHKKGLGMKNIESRLRIINATYEVNSSLKKGIQVVIEIAQPNSN
ncbi:sensor histidine kinase [Kordia sp. YSTF-M3]|uniref:histidine kinase n=1 Tax=Kordia aestuariivivens TaxID=2759037 RepID=A0ABR7QDT7_9FLAO|nr:histidine kinase [Kordia aestuariivivens]MBC8756546.1 sensor histidine kinase [Kordia aestuariivivens]